jgi:hypothetical protein
MNAPDAEPKGVRRRASMMLQFPWLEASYLGHMLLYASEVGFAKEMPTSDKLFHFYSARPIRFT